MIVNAERMMVEYSTCYPFRRILSLNFLLRLKRRESSLPTNLEEWLIKFKVRRIKLPFVRVVACGMKSNKCYCFIV